jgi:hypothetical protein
VWLGCTSARPLGAVSKDRIGLLKSRAAAAHESSRASPSATRSGRLTTHREAKVGALPSAE